MALAFGTLQVTFGCWSHNEIRRAAKRWVTFPDRRCFYGLTQAVVSALVVLEVAHSQCVRRNLLAALWEGLDNVEARPRTEFLVLHARRDV